MMRKLGLLLMIISLASCGSGNLPQSQKNVTKSPLDMANGQNALLEEADSASAIVSDTTHNTKEPAKAK